jgi:CubicO group peptidase (beta-lactamase class C family)
MAPALSPETVTALRNYVDNATIGTSSTIPGVVLHIVDGQANTLFSHDSSKSAQPNGQSIGIIQSLTKLVGAIAFLKLVERGITSLDDPDIIPTHLPELAAKRVLTGYTTDANGKKIWNLEDRDGDITPRMLLNHMYGGGHTYMDQLLFEYFQDQSDIDWTTTNEAADTYGTLLASPLLYQPGTKTSYGQGLDWIAILIERLTKQRLSDYLQSHIFDPLGLRTMGFEPGFGGTSLLDPSNAGKFWPRVLRTGDEYLTLDPKIPETITHPDAYPKGSYHTGRLGTGLISSAEDYTHLLTIFLPANAGTDPITGHRLLSPSSIHEISNPQLPAHIQHDSRNIPASSASPIILPAYLQSALQDPEGSYGLGCGVQGADRVLKGDGRGRRKGSVYWYGAANTEYWIDVEMGIVVFVNGNYYPWNEGVWTEFVAGVEGIVYGGLTSV